MLRFTVGVLFLVIGSAFGAEEWFRLDSKSREAILKHKNRDIMLEKNIEFWQKNPLTDKQRQCYDKMKQGQSINFVLDLAASPSRDRIDNTCANSPIGLMLDLHRDDPHWSASKAYFDAVQTFIDAVTVGMKPEWTHSVIFEDNRRFYLRGRSFDDIELKHFGVGSFSDEKRNLKTMWPVPTTSKPQGTEMVKNNLGRMTKMALWNRDNGMPTVLGGSQRSKAVYTIVISDGASGAKLEELSRDLGRTTVIDVGQNRFASRLSWDELKRLASLITMDAPQELPNFISTVRNMACWLITNEP